MKSSVKISIVLFVLFFLVSCTSTDPHQSVLNRADSLMSLRPDSALRILEKIDLQELTTSAVRARYAVLLTQGKDKNYICHTHDSLIRSAVAYYESTGDKAMKAKARYYLGRVLQDMEDRKAAAQEYLEVIPLAEDTEDMKLLAMAVGNLGHIYAKEGLFDKADSLYFRLECLAVVLKDSAKLATSLTMRGYICMEKEAMASPSQYYYNRTAECFLKQALQIAGKIGNSRIERNVLLHLGILYDRLENTDQTIAYIKKGILSQQDSTKHYGYYLTLGNVYSRTCQFDSAVYCFMQSLRSTNYYTKAGAATVLSKIADTKGDLKQALYWKNLHANFLDSAAWSERPVDMVTSEHDLKMKQLSGLYKSGLTGYQYLLFSLLIVLLGLGILWWHKKKKFHQKMAALEKEKNGIQENASAQLVYIELSLTEKEALLHVKNEELLRMRGEMGISERERREILVLKNQIDALYRDRQEAFLRLLCETEAYQKLVTFIQNYVEGDSKDLGEVHWKEFVREVNRISNGFTAHLKKKYPSLNEEDIRFCCLLKADFSYVELARLYGRTSNAMYKRRNAILEKISANTDERLEDIVVREFGFL